MILKIEVGIKILCNQCIEPTYTQFVLSQNSQCVSQHVSNTSSIFPSIRKLYSCNQCNSPKRRYYNISILGVSKAWLNFFFFDGPIINDAHWKRKKNWTLAVPTTNEYELHSLYHSVDFNEMFLEAKLLNLIRNFLSH